MVDGLLGFARLRVSLHTLRVWIGKRPGCLLGVAGSSEETEGIRGGGGYSWVSELVRGLPRLPWW